MPTRSALLGASRASEVKCARQLKYNMCHICVAAPNSQNCLLRLRGGLACRKCLQVEYRTLPPG